MGDDERALHSEKSPRSSVRDAMDSILLSSLRPLLIGLAVLYALTLVAKPFLPRSAQPPLYLASTSIAFAFLAAAYVLGRWRPPPRLAHPIGAAIAAIVLANTLLHLFVRGEPLESLNVLLLMLGVAIFSTSIPWFAAIISGILLAWGIAAWAGPPSPDWPDLMMLVAEGTVIAVVVFMVRVRIIKHFMELREARESRTRDLETTVTALERSEGALKLQGAILSSQLEAGTDGVLVVDLEGKIILHNERFLEMWGLPKDVIVAGSDERALHEVIPKLKDPGGFLARVRSLYDHPEEKSRERVELMDGRVFERNSAPVRSPEGTIYGRAWAFRDISERERHERSLREQRDRLERLSAELSAANRDLEAFSYSVSHDLKAPARGIAAITQAILDDHQDDLDPDAKRLLERLSAESMRMGQLVDDFMRLAGARQGELHIVPVDVSRIARAILDDLARAHPERRVATYVAPDMHARADERLLQVALENLLSNAWKFTSKTPDARIEVGCSSAGPVEMFYVRDNGAGFHASDAHLLFQPFRRLHGNAYAGTGIGLATVSRIIARHGGRVWGESAGEGKGATIWFTLRDASAATR